MLPTKVGLNVMPNVQVPAAASDEGQVLLTIAKSLLAESVPMVTALPPVLVTVMLWLALLPPDKMEKVRLVLLSEIGAVVPPVAAEASLTTSGVALGALSVMIMAPSSTADVGVTATDTVQFPVLAARGVVRHVPVLIV